MIEKIEGEILSGNLHKIVLSWRLQQTIDCSPSGGLHYEGITILRDAIGMTFTYQKSEESEFIEHIEDGQRKRRKLMLPSNFSIRKCTANLEQHEKN